jgi:hypothetical protein
LWYFRLPTAVLTEALEELQQMIWLNPKVDLIGTVRMIENRMLREIFGTKKEEVRAVIAQCV